MGTVWIKHVEHLAESDFCNHISYSDKFIFRKLYSNEDWSNEQLILSSDSTVRQQSIPKCIAHKANGIFRYFACNVWNHIGIEVFYKGSFHIRKKPEFHIMQKKYKDRIME